eukprot:snap_masked-scaffold_5-processed-gene-7.9-mRNA-1 protein AED:0.02 eAED:0.02 QI:0/0/0/1/1/1/2/0/345
MSVLFQYSAGTFVVDFYTESAPKNCQNIIKLCNIEKNYMLQTGDRTATGKKGTTAERYLASLTNEETLNQSQYIKDEVSFKDKVNKKGLVCMISTSGKDTNTSCFFITLRDEDLDHLDGLHTVIGEIAEGFDELYNFTESVFVDKSFRPLQDIRILHSFVLDDPFPALKNEEKVKLKSPQDFSVPLEEEVEERVPYGETLDNKEFEGLTEEEKEKLERKKEAKSRAEVLEMVGDLPEADVSPDKKTLFVCKLNAITTDEDLELIFSRFGEIISCDILKDRDTGESLQYAFIEFGTEEQCVEAYVKMNNVMIDDRRIKVDFSQSVADVWNKWTMTRKNPRKKRKRS